MKMLAINASPRKTWNTATLLEHAMDGAESLGAEIKLVHLYDLDYQGCTSCFGCKKKGAGKKGVCAMKDDLAPILEEIQSSDAVMFGSPIYFGNITGELISLMERLLFSVLSYNEGERSVYERSLHTGFIYTMNAPLTDQEEMGMYAIYDGNQRKLSGLYRGHSEYILSCETYQFDDYSKYEGSRFDVEHREKMRQEQFPIDCQNAFELGKSLAILCTEGNA